MVVRKILAVDVRDSSVVGPGVLTQPTEKITDFGPQLETLVADLRDTMHEYPICVGLAAPQIGVGRSVAVINVSEGKSEPDLILVNPEIVSSTGSPDSKFESCMSLPLWKGVVPRRQKLYVRFQDASGAHQELTTHGFLARAIMHEVDHLSGKLFYEYSGLGELQATDIFADYLERSAGLSDA